eukprot:1123319-Rhodomonas_salina.1
MGAEEAMRGGATPRAMCMSLSVRSDWDISPLMIWTPRIVRRQHDLELTASVTNSMAQHLFPTSHSLATILVLTARPLDHPARAQFISVDFERRVQV